MLLHDVCETEGETMQEFLFTQSSMVSVWQNFKKWDETMHKKSAQNLS